MASLPWVATEFFARPLTRFFALPIETAEALARYEDRVDPDPDVFSLSEKWLAERIAAYERCGAGLTGFALSNSFLARCLYRFPPKRFRYYVRSAGSRLLSLAEARPGKEISDQFRRQVEVALKLSYGMAKRRRRWSLW